MNPSLLSSSSPAGSVEHRLDISELIHELRQPLDVIEALAFYLEITSSDEESCQRLQKIQAMVARANQILQQSEIV